jgi:hypothetical protein
LQKTFSIFLSFHFFRQPVIDFSSVSAVVLFLKKSRVGVKYWLLWLYTKGIKIEATKESVKLEIKGVADLDDAIKHFRQLVADQSAHKAEKAIVGINASTKIRKTSGGKRATLSRPVIDSSSLKKTTLSAQGKSLSGGERSKKSSAPRRTQRRSL